MAEKKGKIWTKYKKKTKTKKLYLNLFKQQLEYIYKSPQKSCSFGVSHNAASALVASKFS